LLGICGSAPAIDRVRDAAYLFTQLLHTGTLNLFATAPRPPVLVRDPLREVAKISSASALAWRNKRLVL